MNFEISEINFEIIEINFEIPEIHFKIPKINFEIPDFNIEIPEIHLEILFYTQRNWLWILVNLTKFGLKLHFSNEKFSGINRKSVIIIETWLRYQD